MKKKLILLTLLPLLFINLMAQMPSWIDSYGGDLNDVSNSVAVDSYGNTYITGTFESNAIFPAPHTLSNTGGKDMFVAKFNSTGDLIWTYQATENPSTDAFGNDITVDPTTGDVYVIGSFSGSSITFGTLSPLLSSGGSDIYIVKLNNSGVPQWALSSTLGTDDEFGNAIKYFDGNVYATGSFNSSSFSLGDLTALNTNPPASDVFITCLDDGGNTIWINVPKGGNNDYGTDIDVNSLSDIYITGYFNSSSLEFPSGGLILTNSGNYDAFVVRYTSAGMCNWAINPTGAGDDFSRGIVVDDEGDAYITGNFFSSSFSLGTVEILNSGADYSDYFVAKCSPSSDSFLWAHSADGSLSNWNFDDIGKSLALNNCNQVYVTGWFNSFVIDFGTGPIMNATNNNYSDIFVTKYDAISGDILNLYLGTEVINDQGMDMAVKDCDCPVITGWFNDRLNLSGSFVSHSGVYGTSDFYISQICDYNCASPCDNTVVDVSTGRGILIGNSDPNWAIISWPSGINPTDVVACPWFNSSSTPPWSYGAPFTGTNWISVFDSTFTPPQAPLGSYEFVRTFTIDSLTCQQPELNLCVLVDDNAAIYLNGNLLGTAVSMYTPATFTVSGYGPFVNGINTLKIVVHNTIQAMMAFDAQGWVCCNNPPNENHCDSLWVNYQQTDECCSDIYLSNELIGFPIDFIQFSTESGNATLRPGSVPAPWSISPSGGAAVNTFTIFPNTSGTFFNYFNLCLENDPDNNPQQINIVWSGITPNQDTLYCYDTLFLYCPDTLDCDSCDHVIESVTTGNTGTTNTWNLITAPVGITTGPASPVPVIPAGWRLPFTGTNWISFTGTGGGFGSSSAPTGVYHYQTTFCICDTCAENQQLTFHYCVLTDDTADIFLNSVYQATASSQSIPFIGVAAGPLHSGLNTLDVYVTNNPPYYTGFDFKGFLCCDGPNRTEEIELDKMVSVYPNPVTETLFVRSGTQIHFIEIFSLYGKNVVSATIKDYQWSFATNSLATGLYFVKIKTDLGIVNKKIIIKH